MGTGSGKKCPFCAEEILAAALKCKHCGEWLQKGGPYVPEVPGESRELPRSRLTEILQRHLDGIDPNCHVIPNIPAKKLNSVATVYDSLSSQEDVLALYDWTLLGGGKDGFIFATTGFGLKDTMESPIFIHYESLRDDEIYQEDAKLPRGARILMVRGHAVPTKVEFPQQNVENALREILASLRGGCPTCSSEASVTYSESERQTRPPLEVRRADDKNGKDLDRGEDEERRPMVAAQPRSEIVPAEQKAETDLNRGKDTPETPTAFIVVTMAVMGALLVGPGWYFLRTGRNVIGVILMGIFLLTFHSMNTMTKGEPRKARKFFIGFLAAVVSARLVSALLASIFGSS